MERGVWEEKNKKIVRELKPYGRIRQKQRKFFDI
jgi:hypothetical protein